MDLAVNLRRSGAETDYIKTASHFAVIETIHNPDPQMNTPIV